MIDTFTVQVTEHSLVSVLYVCNYDSLELSSCLTLLYVCQYHGSKKQFFSGQLGQPATELAMCTENLG